MIASVDQLVQITVLPFRAAWAGLRAGGKGATLALRAATTQVTHTVIRPLFPMVLVGTVLGAVAAYAINRTIGSTTYSGMVASVLAVTITRELAPLVVALVLVARTGNQVTFQLGLMRAGHELDAMEASGIDPEYFVVLPRLVGITLAALVLTVVFSAAGMVCGHAVARLVGWLSYTVSARDVLDALTARDAGIALVKSALCGSFVAAASCHFALSAERSPVGVREAADNSTLWGYAACITFNAGISVYGFSG